MNLPTVKNVVRIGVVALVCYLVYIYVVANLVAAFALPAVVLPVAAILLFLAWLGFALRELALV